MYTHLTSRFVFVEEIISLAVSCEAVEGLNGVGSLSLFMYGIECTFFLNAHNDDYSCSVVVTPNFIFLNFFLHVMI